MAGQAQRETCPPLTLPHVLSLPNTALTALFLPTRSRMLAPSAADLLPVTPHRPAPLRCAGAASGVRARAAGPEHPGVLHRPQQDVRHIAWSSSAAPWGAAPAHAGGQRADKGRWVGRLKRVKRGKLGEDLAGSRCPVCAHVSALPHTTLPCPVLPLTPCLPPRCPVCVHVSVLNPSLATLSTT